MRSIRNRTSLFVALTAVALGSGIAVVVAAGSGTARASDTITPTGNTVSVSGTGTVQGVPDTLDASFEVDARRASVQSALNDSAADAKEVIAALKAHGVAATDIQTSDVSLNPDYGRHDKIVGYDSSESLDVTIHPISHVGATLSAATTAAGNSVSLDGLSYDIADDTTLLAAARAKAFADAKTSASQYADLAGDSLGSVVSIVSTVSDNSPEPESSSAGVSGSTSGSVAAVPIAVGQESIAVTVKVIWDLQ